jgi:uncharacterized protein YjdB
LPDDPSQKTIKITYNMPATSYLSSGQTDIHAASIARIGATNDGLGILLRI